MGNLILTNSCNIRCPYCFATESRFGEENNELRQASLQEFRKMLAFDGSIVTNFCGGEPTIHPDFCQMLAEVLAIPGKYAHIMTNGLWPDNVREFVSSLPFDRGRVVYLFNVLNPAFYTEQQLARLHATLGAINPEAAFIGFTIYKIPFDYSYILETAQHFGITRIRYSIAAPNIMDPGSWNIDPRRDFRPLARTVYQFIMDARALGMEVNPDCGNIPPCAYTKEELAELLLIKPGINFNCSTVVDIAPGGKAWRCYGLFSVLNADIEDFSGIEELRGYFERRARLLTNIKLFAECEDCEHDRSGLCYGGCLALHVVEALKRDKNVCLFPIDHDEHLIDSIPVPDRRVLKIWNRYDGETVVYLRRGLQVQVEMLEVDGLLLEFIRRCDGRATVADLVKTLQDNYDDEDEARRAVFRMVRQLFERDALTLKTPD